jgi:4-oxalocrotonate tautomerase
LNLKKEEAMPTIFFYGPKLDKEKKKEMIKSFTDTASRLTGIRKSAFVVYLRESTPENVGVGGELLEDVQKAGG